MFGSLASRRSNKSPRRPRAYRPTLECLETRTLPSFVASIPTNVSAPAVALAAGNFITGDNRLDLAVAEDDQGGHVGILLGNGDGTFQGTQLGALNDQPRSIVVGDFNGDGKTDIVAASVDNLYVISGHGDGTFGLPSKQFTFGSGGTVQVITGNFHGGSDGVLDLALVSARTLYVLTNDGHGNFAKSFTQGGDYTSVAAADFDNDGHVDLVVGNDSRNAVTVFPGLGNGNFGTAFDVTTGDAVVMVAAGRLDSTGNMGIVASEPHSYAGSPPNQVEVFKGNGDGTFQNPQVLSTTGTNPGKIVITPLRGDNTNPDLAILDQTLLGTTQPSSNDVSVFLNHGDGTFSPASYAVAGNNPKDLVTGDFNNDGHQDLATANLDSQDVTVLRGTGTGQMLAAANYFGGSGGIDKVVAADLEISGHKDLVAISKNGQYVAVLFHDDNGDGGFKSPLIIPLVYPGGATKSPVSVAVGDLSGDGFPDIVTVNANPDNDMSVLDNNGDGTFTLASSTIPAGVAPTDIVIADFNQDHHPDIAETNGAPSDSTVKIFLNNGDGTFATPQIISFPDSPFGLTVADFNNDGYPDLAVLTSGYTYVLMNDQTGHMQNPGPSLPHAISFAAGELDGDQFPDLVLVDQFHNPQAAQVFKGNGDGSFVQLASYPVGDGHSQLAVGDFNGDGKLDLAESSDFGSPQGLYVLPGDGMDGFGTATVYDSNPAPEALITADLNGDGAPDLAVAYRGNAIQTVITVYLNDAVTHFQVAVPSNVTAGTPFTATVNALDAHLNPVLDYAGTIHFTSSDPAAVLPADSTLQNGVGTFTITLKTAGTQSLTVTATINSAVRGNATVTVSPAAASTLTVAGFPPVTTAGVAGTFTVTAQDAYGNTASGYTGTVSFSSSDSQAVLPGSYTFTSTDAGSHIFGATLKTAGSQGLTATDTASSLSASQTGIQVNPAAASALVLSGFPTSVTAGTAESFTITAQDAYRNTASGYTGTVSFGSSDSQAVLPGSYTFTSTDAGSHTFSAILKTAGSQSLTATDTASSLSASQTGITVHPALWDFAILQADNSLWEHDLLFDPSSPPDAIDAHWRKLSSGAFDSISTATDQKNGSPVLFGILKGDHSLWEHDLVFDPNVPADATDAHWRKLSSAAFASVSAAWDNTGVSGGFPVVFGILLGDHSLWEHNLAFDPSLSPEAFDAHWRKLSSGAFASVSATMDSTGASNGAPVVFGLVQGSQLLWEHDLNFDPSFSPEQIDVHWRQLSSAAFASVSVTMDSTGASNGAPAVFGLVQGSQLLWEHDLNFDPSLSPEQIDVHWRQLSSAAFASVSVTTDSTGASNGAPVVFGLVQGSQLLWEHDLNFDSSLSPGQIDVHWRQLSSAAFASVSVTFDSTDVSNGGPVVFGILRGNGLLWEHDLSFDPSFSPEQIDVHWRQLSSGNFASLSAT